ncbi:TatD related DNase, putative [Leishmania lindenbergi]|uniref:TatD related DNase n=1 Tax=Leishmania lindenbergi TaxID=651832 RepID=A0AAW3A8M9_9TRYP
MLAAAQLRTPPYLVDVAANLTDGVFRGMDWKGNRLRDDDFDNVLARAQERNVQQIIITGTSLAQSVKAIALCRRYPDRRLLCTVGVHPAHCGEFLRPLDLNEIRGVAESDTSMVVAHHNKSAAASTAEQEEVWAQERLDYLVNLVNKNRDVVVAVGEMGIDYAELTCCPREVQEKYFARQLTAFAPLQLPFLFHSRGCGMSFVHQLKDIWARIAADAVATGAVTDIEVAPSPSVNAQLRGVVHSFNGTLEEQEALLLMGLYLSVNCSAFREASLAAQVTSIPLDRLMFETDAPWCDMRWKDYGAQFVRTIFKTTKRNKPFVMGTCLERRNEPCHLVQVMEEYLGCAKACATGPEDPLPRMDEATLVAAVYENCKRLFHL